MAEGHGGVRVTLIRMPRLAPRLVLALTATALLPAVAGAAGTPPGILYSVDAPNAVLTLPGGGPMQLSLPAPTRVTWFTDRPDRRAGSITLGQLAQMWSASGFDADPPNAALVLSRRGQDRTHVVELSLPAITGSRVTFTTRAMPRSRELGYRHTDALRPGRYGAARVFIDDAAVSPCGTHLQVVQVAGRLSPTRAQCLLAPGASVTAHAIGSPPVNGTNLYACQAGGGTAGIGIYGSTRSVTACGTTLDPVADGDTDLGGLGDFNGCGKYASTQALSNLDTQATVRVSTVLQGACAIAAPGR